MADDFTVWKEGEPLIFPGAVDLDTWHEGQPLTNPPACYTLSISPNYLEHYGDSILLNSIEVQHSYHLNFADPITLSFTLEIASNFHLNVSDPIDLLEILDLIVAPDNYHEHYVDPDPLPVFDQFLGVAIPASHHDHVVDPDNLPLDQEHNLSINGDYLEHYGDTFTFEGMVPADNAYHLHEADSPALIPYLNIPVSYHLHDGDSCEVILPIDLEVFSCVHSHFCDGVWLDTETIEKLGISDESHDYTNWYCQGSYANLLIVPSKGNNPKLIGCAIYVGSIHNEQVRLACYTGANQQAKPGSADKYWMPEGEDLLVDFGQTSGSGTNEWLELACTSTSVNLGDYLWFGVKANYQGFKMPVTHLGTWQGDWEYKDSGDEPYSKMFKSSNDSVPWTTYSAGPNPDETLSWEDPWADEISNYPSSPWLTMWHHGINGYLKIKYESFVTLQVKPALHDLVSNNVETYGNDREVQEAYHDIIDDGFHLILDMPLINEAYHENVAGPVTLITNRLVLPDECYHEHVADPPVPLTVHLDVALDNYHLTVSTDNIQLTIPALEVANGFHLVKDTEPTLTKYYTLSVLDCVHATYNDQPVLQFDALGDNWGQTATGGGGIQFEGSTYYCGNLIKWPGCKVKINRYYLHVASTHDIQARLAVYQGPTTDVADRMTISESTLIADFGLTSGTKTDQWIYIDAPSNTYLNNTKECVFIVKKNHDQVTHMTINLADEATNHDFADLGVTNGGWLGKITDDSGTPGADAEENVAYPSTFTFIDQIGWNLYEHTGTDSTLCAYLTVTVDSYPTLMVKPGVMEIHDDPVPLTEVEILKGFDSAYHEIVTDPIFLDSTKNLANLDAYNIVVDGPFYFVYYLDVAQDNYHNHFAEQCEVLTAEPLLIADCYHENIPDPIDLIQLHILTVVACYHAHAGPQIQLTQNHSLADLDAYSPIVTSGLNLTQKHDLTCQEAYSLHFADAPYLALRLPIAPNGIEHYADTFGLIVHLDISESYHEHYSDALTLSLHMLVAESHHEVVTDPLPLLQYHSLVVLGAFHEHFTDLADLIEVATLVINPCFHLHEGESIPLGVHLTIQEAYHEHYIDHIPLIMALLLADAYHLLDNDLIIFEQLHYLEIAGTVHNTSTNYHVLTSDNMDWGYLSPALDFTSFKNLTAHRDFDIVNPSHSLKQINAQRAIENVTATRSLKSLTNYRRELPKARHLSLVNTTTDRTFEPRTPVLSLKWIQDQRDLEDVTTYRTMRKAA